MGACRGMGACGGGEEAERGDMQPGVETEYSCHVVILPGSYESVAMVEKCNVRMAISEFTV